MHKRAVFSQELTGKFVVILGNYISHDYLRLLAILVVYCAFSNCAYVKIIKGVCL